MGHRHDRRADHAEPATIVISVDHFSAECVGTHAARHGTRFQALEPLGQGLRQHFGGYHQEIAAGLALRHDHGSRFLSHFYQTALLVGIRSSPTFVREPEGNGCSEQFIRTLKEQLLWIEPFATVEELRHALLAFKDRYDRGWLIEHHGHRSPSIVRGTFPRSELDHDASGRPVVAGLGTQPGVEVLIGRIGSVAVRRLGAFLPCLEQVALGLHGHAIGGIDLGVVGRIPLSETPGGRQSSRWAGPATGPRCS